MVRSFTIAILLLHSGLQVGSLQAQLRGYGPPPAAREPARTGLIGGLREAREERFRRETQAAATAARAAAAGPVARNPNASSLTNPNVNSRSLATPANPRSNEATRAANSGRSANYGSANQQNPNARTSRTYVAPASANTFVPAPFDGDLNYEGSGVAIRLPEDARGVVNYLVDDVETSTLRPGQQQVLDSKGSFVIRYSRGVTADGRSFGESRYTVTEGNYRFELGDTGWELYRESESEGQLAPPNRIDVAGSNQLPDPSVAEQLGPILGRSRDGFPSSKPLSRGSRELPAESLATERPEPPTSEPSVTEAAEELPAPKPRSILEK